MTIWHLQKDVQPLQTIRCGELKIIHQRLLLEELEMLKGMHES